MHFLAFIDALLSVRSKGYMKLGLTLLRSTKLPLGESHKSQEERY